MEAVTPNQSNESINVYLIGNNPIELSSIYEKLKAIKNRTFNTEIGFELKGLVKKIRKFSPSCILIDDNLERLHIKKLLKGLSANIQTRDIPITVIKNSNYKEGFGEVEDYVLKDVLTSESLFLSINNSIRLSKMHRFILKKYRKNKSIITSLFQA
jgi:response regulator RpfG family c-di-GMP phosphodiesterase